MHEEHCLIVHESLHVTVVCSFVSVNPHAVSSSLAMELDVDQFVEEFLVKSRSAPKQVESVLASTYIHRYQYNAGLILYLRPRYSLMYIAKV